MNLTRNSERLKITVQVIDVVQNISSHNSVQQISKNKLRSSIDVAKALLANIMLSPLQAMWPMEPALISCYCSVKQKRVFEFPWTGH